MALNKTVELDTELKDGETIAIFAIVSHKGGQAAMCRIEEGDIWPAVLLARMVGDRIVTMRYGKGER